MRQLFFFVLVGLMLGGSVSSATSAEFRVGAGDSVETVLAAQKGKRVTIRLRSGQELTGTVREVTGRVVQLGALAGKEFYDAVLSLDAVEAIVVRTKE
ncbi:MAG: hypothetical protein HY695_34520 [Deltaproteobacteria bacterium]|nr:hypothetical protein [Deltaproteobacteria bacterium]